MSVSSGAPPVFSCARITDACPYHALLRRHQMTGEVGSYRYMAPEVVKHQPYNAKVDIYSWAILSWEILAIDRPYSWATETTFVTVSDERKGQTTVVCCVRLYSARRMGLSRRQRGTCTPRDKKRTIADLDKLDLSPLTKKNKHFFAVHTWVKTIEFLRPSPFPPHVYKPQLESPSSRGWPTAGNGRNSTRAGPADSASSSSLPGTLITPRGRRRRSSWPN